VKNELIRKLVLRAFYVSIRIKAAMRPVWFCRR
jgi:hypothetical protein